MLKSCDEFRARLQSFFKRAADLNAGRFAASTDTSFMPRPWEMKGTLDLVTADFTYVRWLGKRKGIEEQTTTWDKTVIDRQSDLRSWLVVLRRLVEDKRIRKIFAFANNHYAAYAPATAFRCSNRFRVYCSPRRRRRAEGPSLLKGGS